MISKIRVHPGAYRTVQDRDSGLTHVICNYCEGSHIAGENQDIHLSGCPELVLEQPKRRFKALRRIITFQVYAEVMPDGSLVIP